MRRTLSVVAIVAVLVALWGWIPSAVVERRVREAVSAQLQPGSLRVRVRTTLLGLVTRRARSLDITAEAVRLGDLTAQRLTVRLRGLRLRDGGQAGKIATEVESGTAEVVIGARDLERYLVGRGVQQPVVTIDDAGVALTGGVQMGPVAAQAKVTGLFYVVGDADVHFRITSLDMSGMEIPGTLATAVLGLAGHPVLSLRDLPVPVTIERIHLRPTHIVLQARAGRAQP